MAKIATKDTQTCKKRKAATMKANEKTTREALPKSDLATECLSRAISSEEASYNEKTVGCVTLSALTVKSERNPAGKPRGRYLALSFPSPAFWVEKERMELLSLFSLSLRFFFSPPPSRLLIAGLGNRRLTADSLGVAVADMIDATAAMPAALVEKFGIAPLTKTGVSIPDVFAKTGIESVHTVSSAASLFVADAVLAFDALAAKEKAKLLSVIELTDTGTVPGGGVKRGSLALSRESLGIPVISVGVPTVMRTEDSYFLVPQDLEEGIRALASLLAEAVNTVFSAKDAPHDTTIEQLFSEAHA